MLKKLFKYEWQSCWIAAVSITIYFMLYMTAVGALSFIVSFYFYLRFYNNLYTDQGYLMHTLPVTSGQLIWSKAFVGVIWHFISGMVIVFSVTIVMVSMIVGTSGENLSAIWNEIISSIELPDFFVPMVLEVILLAVVSGFLTVFLGYTAVSIGQPCKKQKVLGAIGAYVVIYIIMQIVSSYATIPVSTFVDTIGPEDGLMIVAILFILAIVLAAITAGLYYFNVYIMKNKLNLE